MLIPKIGSEWPAGVVNQTRGPNGIVPKALGCGSRGKAERACCKRADLHGVPLLGSSNRDLCAAYDSKTLPIHAHTLLVTLKDMMHVQGDTAVGEIPQPARHQKRE